jgi:hypothetical protein
MYELMDRHYVNVRQNVFDADLAEKRWVILLQDPVTEELCGFSTQRLLTVEAGGEQVTALFSGDTIIAREKWGESALPHVWGRLALSLIDEHSGGPLYWFLISKGYKTYRFLPLFFREFYPRYDRATPREARAIIDALAGSRWPGFYDSGAGVIRATASKDRLRPGIADVTDARLRDAQVRFFLERNPGFADGDELCCLAPLTRDNFTPAAWRVIGAAPGARGVA